MVGNYTINSRDAAAIILSKAEKAREELEDLIDMDAEAYSALSDCLKSGNKDEAGLQGLYEKAADVPYEICKLSAECLGLCRKIVKIQNKRLVTDTASAATMLESAFFSARFNVYINLKFIKDMEFVGRMHRELSRLEKSVPKLKEEIIEMCEDAIYGGEDT